MVRLNIQQLFPTLTDLSLIKEIEESGISKDFEQGEEIIRKGQFLNFMPLILSGSVKVIREEEDGREVLLYYLEGGNTCAMSITCCLNSAQSSINAIAEDKTELLMIPLQKSEEWMAKYSNWRNFILMSYANRMEELLYTVDSVAFRSLDERLLKYLEAKAHILKKREFSITHSEIAKELNSSREAISRLLKKLENIEVVELGRNKVKLLN